MSFFTDLPITESAILSTLWKFEGCLGVEGWLKTGNKGHYFQAWLSLEVCVNFFSSFVDQRLGWAPFYQGCHHEEISDFGSESDQTLTPSCATFSPVTPIFYCISAVYMSQRTFVQNLRKIYLIFLPRPRYLNSLLLQFLYTCRPHVNACKRPQKVTGMLFEWIERKGSRSWRVASQHAVTRTQSILSDKIEFPCLT